MKRRRWLTVVATVAVLALVASACSNDDDGGTGGGTDTGSAAADEFGTVEIAAGEPINVGVAQVISGADAALGQDQVNGIELAVDYLDGTFDATGGHPARSPGRVGGGGRALHGRGWPGGCDRARRRSVDRRGARHQLLERRPRRGGHDPRRQGDPPVLGLEHESGADLGGGAPALLRAHGPQRPHPGCNRRRVRAERAGSHEAGNDPRREPVYAGPHGCGRRQLRGGRTAR